MRPYASGSGVTAFYLITGGSASEKWWLIESLEAFAFVVLVKVGVKKQNSQPSSKPNVSANNTAISPPSPDNNGRKFNVKKSESPQWQQLDNVKNTKLKTSGHGASQRYYEWDYLHNDIEVYNNRGVHLGSMDPVTGEMYKPAVPGRTITIP